MNLRNFILLAALVFSSTTNAATETNNARPLKLEEAIQLALQHNLDVQIERFGPQIATFNLSGVYSAYDPVFTVQAEESFRSSPGGFDSRTGLTIPGNETYVDSLSPGLAGALPSGLTYNINGDLMNRSSGTRSFVNTTFSTNGVIITTNNSIATENRGFQYNPTIGIDLSQPLLKNFWIDNTRQQIWVNRKTLKISELGVRLQVMTVANHVEQAYYDLIFAIENVRVQEKALELADRLQAENKRRVEVGALAPLDEKQAEAQAAASRADLLTARGNLEAQENVLKNLITDDYKQWHGVTIEPVGKLVAVPEKFDVMESWQHGMTQRPDLLQSRVDIERRDIVLRYERNQLFPQLDLIGSYGRNGLDNHWGGALQDLRDETNPRFSYGILFSIPLSNRGPRTRYQASKAEKAQALLQLKKLEQGILVEIDDAVKLAQTSLERVDATRQARLYAESALEAEQKKLENGKSTSFVVLQLQRDLTTARSQEIRALADYNKALAQLAFNEGTSLERNHLSMGIK